MFRIAIIQFPGSNCELEAARAVERAGMQVEIWRWNRPMSELEKFDGFIVPGGFSYEDRIRAGVIAAHDEVMAYVRQAAEAEKPVMGICNGAQILVEAGMVPGGRSDGQFFGSKTRIPTERRDLQVPPSAQEQERTEPAFLRQFSLKKLSTTAYEERVNNIAFGGERGGEVSAMLAINKRVNREGRLLGVGYYNDWVGIRSELPRGRSAFTLAMNEGDHFRLPVAHGEGRFLFSQETFEYLEQHQQTLFRYCDKDGDVSEFFPINTNGATHALAGVCNEEGNVLALMPHPERTKEGTVIFESMREYLEQGRPLPPRSWASTGRPSATDPLVRGGQEEETHEPSQVQRELSKYFERPAADETASDLGLYTPPGIELLVKLIITDNTADTVAGVLARRGMNDLRLQRFVHWEARVEGAADLSREDKQSIALALIKAEEILNINKETPFVRSEGQWYTYQENGLQEAEAPWKRNGVGEQVVVLVGDREDFIGQQVLGSLRARLQFDGLMSLQRGVVWVLSGPQAREAYTYMLSRNMFANPVGQEIVKYE